MSPFRRGGGGKKRDTAEAPIIQAGRQAGAEVWQISGTGLPDLLVRYPAYTGRFYAGEVKSQGGIETVHQGAFPIWRTPQDLLQAIGAVQ